MNVPHNERSPGEDVMGQKGQREKLPESVIETIYREITVQQQVVLKETVHYLSTVFLSAEYTTDSLLISINACICVSLQLPYIAVYPFLTLSVTIAMRI